MDEVSHRQHDQYFAVYQPWTRFDFFLSFVLTNVCPSPEPYPDSGTGTGGFHHPPKRRLPRRADGASSRRGMGCALGRTIAFPFPSTLREAVLQRGCRRQLLGTSPLLQRLRPRRTCPRHTPTLACARSRSHSHMLALSRACTHVMKVSPVTGNG